MKPYKQEYFSLLENYINEYQNKYLVTPSILEIEKALGIPKTTVSRYLTYMDKNGMLEYKGRRRIVTKKAKIINNETVQIPVLGSVSCGLPKYAEENIEDYIRVPASWFSSGEYYALKANGDSMKNVGIDNGDLVIIRKQEQAESGQIVVGLLNNEEATLKRFRRSRGNVELIPENDDYETRVVNLQKEEFSIQGIAVKVIKDLR